MRLNAAEFEREGDFHEKTLLRSVHPPVYLRLCRASVLSIPNMEMDFRQRDSPTTTIQFTIPSDGHVTLKVYDILGRELTTLISNPSCPTLRICRHKSFGGCMMTPVFLWRRWRNGKAISKCMKPSSFTMRGIPFKRIDRKELQRPSDGLLKELRRDPLSEIQAGNKKAGTVSEVPAFHS